MAHKNSHQLVNSYINCPPHLPLNVLHKLPDHLINSFTPFSLDPFPLHLLSPDPHYRTVTAPSSTVYSSPLLNLVHPRVIIFFFNFKAFEFLHLLLNRSGDNNASGSPHRRRLDENAAADADDLGNIGLVIDLLRRDEPENLTLDSDNGKNPLRLKKGDFIPL